MPSCDLFVVADLSQSREIAQIIVTILFPENITTNQSVYRH